MDDYNSKLSDDSINQILPNIAVDKEFSNKTFCDGDINELVMSVKSKLPYSKTIIFANEINGDLLKLRHKLLNSGIKVIMLELAQAVLDVDKVKHLFNVPFDVRSVIVMSENLYEVACYYSKIRNLPLFMFCKNYIPQAVAHSHLIIRNKRVIHKVKNDCQQIVFMADVYKKPYDTICIIGELLFMVDYISIKLLEGNKTDNRYIKMVVNFVSEILRGNKDSFDKAIKNNLINIMQYKTNNMNVEIMGAMDSLYYIKGLDKTELINYQCAYIKILRAELKRATAITADEPIANKKGYMDSIKEMSKAFDLDISYLENKALDNIFKVIDGKITLKALFMEKFMYEIICMLNDLVKLDGEYDAIMKKPLIKEKEQLKLMGLSPISLNFMSLYLR